MAWGFVALAGGTIVGGLISSSGANSAANTQAQGATSAAQIAANSQLQGLNLVQQQEQPYNQAGQLALSQYEQLLGLGGGGSQTTGTANRPGGTATVQNPQQRAVGVPGAGPSGTTGATQGSSGTAQGFDVSKLPGYQFEIQQGQNAIENSAASRGQALSGNTMQGLEQFGQGLASTQFQQYMQQLAGLANMGQAAASNTANQGASLLSGAGASLAGGVNASANANAANSVAQGNIWGSTFNSPSVQGGIQQGLSSLFNSGTPNYLQTPTLDPSVFSQ